MSLKSNVKKDAVEDSVLPPGLRPPELDRLGGFVGGVRREHQVPLTGPGSLTTDFVRRASKTW